MTDTAIILCGDVIELFGSCDTRVMAGGAIIGIYALVVKSYTGKAGKVIDIVTGRAIQGRWNVDGIDFGVFVSRYHSIVASRTVVNDTGMIEDAIGEVTPRGVANATIVCSRHVVECLTGPANVVVARIAAATHNGRDAVVDKPVGKISRVMAKSTIDGGYQRVRGSRRLADRGNTMAGITPGRQDDGVSVVGNGALKAYGRMA